MAAVLLLGVFLAALVGAALAPRAVLLLAIFLIPWGGLDVDIGLRITAYQLVLAGLVATTLVRLTRPGWQPAAIAGGGLLLAMAVHAAVWSLVQLGFIPLLAIGDGALRGPQARAAIQILLYLFSLSPAVLVPLLLSGPGDVTRAFRVYLASLTVLAVIGWLQVVVWYGTGTNPLPVGAVNIALGGSLAYLREGAFTFDSLNIYRMNSLAGEPRNLATALILGLLALQALALAAPRPPGWRLALLWLFLLASTLLTFSTSGAVGWVAGTAVLLPALWVSGLRVARRPATIAAALLAIVVPLAGAVVAAEAAGVPVINLLAERTLDRLENNGAVEDFDVAIVRWLNADPAAIVTGVGLGNVHLYASRFLDPIVALYAEGQVFTGKTSIVRITSELGAIGLALFLGWYLNLCRLARAGIAGQPQLAPALPIALATLVIFLSTNQVAGEVWALGGGLAVLAAQRERARFASGLAA